MFIEKIKSAGLAHLSYLIGDGGQAAVIDPRRDCEIYIEMARERDCRITHIFETHRNEDLVSGAPVLADLTGASVYHGPNAADEIEYAETACAGDSFYIGTLLLTVLETPGHTDDSLSYTVFDENSGDEAVGVFTGDTLFIGDVGRTDFYPDRAKEVAGLLFDSLNKIISIGDQAIIYPAHGAGSVCGDNMANREFSTVGYERQNNPMLQIGDRDTFIAKKLAEHHDQPPYFRLMEHLNSIGAAPADRVMTLPAFDNDAFVKAAENAQVVDVRGVTAFLGSHLPNSFAIPDDMVPAFAGWLLDAEREILLVSNNAAQAEAATRHLIRIGYDHVTGFLSPSLTGWAATANPFRSVTVIDAADVASRISKQSDNWTLLDVRSKSEIESGVIRGSLHIYVGELLNQLETLERNRHYTVMCASGARATIAASILLQAGFQNVDVFLGSMGAWKASENETVTPKQ